MSLLVKTAGSYTIYLATILAINKLAGMEITALGAFFSKVNVSIDVLTITLALFIVHRFLLRFFFRNKWSFLVILAFIIFYIVDSWQNNGLGQILSVLKITFFYMITFRIILGLLSWYLQKKEAIKITINDLRDNMIVQPEEMKKVVELIGERTFNEKFGSDPRARLNRGQISYLKDIFRGLGETEIEVIKVFPFAPFLTAACLVTIILHGSAIAFVMKLFKN
jgi:hypothetical protein